jgi:hypothetical protein
VIETSWVMIVFFIGTGRFMIPQLSCISGFIGDFFTHCWSLIFQHWSFSGHYKHPYDTLFHNHGGTPYGRSDVTSIAGAQQLTGILNETTPLHPLSTCSNLIVGARVCSVAPSRSDTPQQPKLLIINENQQSAEGYLLPDKLKTSGMRKARSASYAATSVDTYAPQRT